MEFYDILKNRYSCRSFTDKEISDEIIDKIIEAGILSPTAVNFQPEKIYVIKSEDMLLKLKEATKYTFDAKVIFAIGYDTNISWKRKSDGVEFGPIDATIVTTNMMNMAYSLGLGSCFVCSMHQDRVEEILNLPKNIKILSLLPVGYPNEFKDNKNRKNKEEIVEYK